jgi:hypothetical protein
VLTRRLVVAAVLCLGSWVALARESAQESEFVGAAHCGQCHPAEYDAWRKTTHARALDRLAPEERKNPRCRACHTTAPDEPDGALGGVQCEACHGRGRYYAARLVMRDPELRAALYWERGGPETCARCHDDNSPAIRPFEYQEKLRVIWHGAGPAVTTPTHADAGPAPATQPSP